MKIMSPCFRRVFLFVVALGLSSAVLVQAAEKPIFFGKSKEPVNIAADKLDFDQKKHVAVFTGNVIVQQAKTTLEADTLRVLFAPGKTQDLKEIIATGKQVVVKMEQKKALCRKMHYFAVDRKIVLTGKPSLDDGKNIISGEAITFFIDEERSVVKSGQQRRVKTTIFPGQRGSLGLRAQ